MHCPAPLHDGITEWMLAHIPSRDRETPGFTTSETCRSPSFSHQAADMRPRPPQRSDVPICDSPPKCSRATGTEHHPQEGRTRSRHQHAPCAPQQPPRHPELAGAPLNSSPAEPGMETKPLPSTGLGKASGPQHPRAQETGNQFYFFSY